MLNKSTRYSISWFAIANACSRCSEVIWFVGVCAEDDDIFVFVRVFCALAFARAPPPPLDDESRRWCCDECFVQFPILSRLEIILTPHLLHFPPPHTGNERERERERCTEPPRSRRLLYLRLFREAAEVSVDGDETPTRDVVWALSN